LSRDIFVYVFRRAAFKGAVLKFNGDCRVWQGPVYTSLGAYR